MADGDTGRVKEPDLVSPALRLMYERTDGYISTSDLIVELTDIFNPKGKDAELLEGRTDTHFSQKVRNLVSHKERGTSFIAQGLADYTGDGFRITAEGRAFVDSLIQE